MKDTFTFLFSIMDQEALTWVFSAFRVILLLTISYFVRHFIVSFLKHYSEKAIEHKKTLGFLESNIAIIRTVTPIVTSSIHLFLWVLTILLILSELKINIMPIVYSLSILGLAFSIGSQTLVKDFINGLITLIEGNIAVGDYVTIKGNKGFVETMSLRCIHLRHSTGELETIPFSEITHVTNHSRDFSIPILSCTVAYGTDIKLVESCFYEVYKVMKKDPDFSSCIQSDLRMAGVSKISQGGVTIDAYVKIAPDPGQKFMLIFYKILADVLARKQVKLPSCACCMTNTTKQLELLK